ncbi:MAG TPA: CHAT domain-containing protein [Allocoleopsis sp.]
MARKRAIFLGRVQSFLVIGRRSWLIKYALIFTLIWGLILFPSLLPNFGSAIARFRTPAIAQSSVDQPSVDSGSALSKQAQQLYEQGDLEAAVFKLEQALEQFRLSGNALQQAQAWSNLSLIHQARADWRQAKIAIKNSIQLAQLGAKQDPSWLSVQAQAFETQAQLNFRLGKLEPATQDWDQAARYYTQAKNQLGAIRSQLWRSLALQEAGLHREALQRLLSLTEDQSLALALATDSGLQATCLRSLGSAIRIVGSGDVQTAEQPQTLTLSELGQRCGVDLSPSADTGYLDQVTALFQKARAIAPSPKMQAEISLLLGHTAQDKLRQLQDTYERQPNKFPAQDLQAQLIAISQAYEQAGQSSDALVQAQAEVSKLSVLVNLDRWLQGQETQLQQQSSEEFFVGENALQAIASLRQELKPSLTDQQAQLPDLIDQLHRLSPSHTAFYTRLQFVHSLLPVANDQLYVEPITLSSEQTLALLESTLAQAKELGDRRSEALAEGYLGQWAESQGQWLSVKEHTQSAIAIAEGIVAPDIAYQWHWQMGRLFKQQDRTSLAIKEYEMAIANLDQVRSDQISLKNADIQFSFRDQVEPIYRQLIELLLQPLEAVAVPDQLQLEKARRTLESLQLAELENYLRCTLQPANPKQLDSLSDQHNAAILYPIILPKQIAVIAKLPGLEQLIYFSQIVSEAEVRAQLINLRMKVEENRFSATGQQAAKTVYSWLIQPLGDSQFNSFLKSTKTLIFVSDGLFRNIPMAVLQDPNTSKYLIQKYAIALNLNLQLQNPQSFYDRSHLILAAGLTDEGLGGLPNAKAEIETISKNFPTDKLLNPKFTLSKFRQKINSRPYTIVHIASHGDFTSQPETTGIKSATGLIKLNEIKESFEIQSQARPEPIELLVLSACRTSDGDRRATLGLAGIAVQSGARSTLASLWYVDDESTSLMMKLFYEKLKASNSSLSKAELLQIAQKELMAHPNFGAPRYWAPFVLLGNWL